MHAQAWRGFAVTAEFNDACRLPLSSFHKGRRAWAMLLHEVAEQWGTPASDVSSCSAHDEAHAKVQ